METEKDNNNRRMTKEFDTYSITTTLNEIVISIFNKQYNKFAISFLLFWAVIIALFPFFVFVIVVLQKNGLPFSFVFICLISFYVAYYLFKIIFWNIYGKEIVTITKENTLSIFCDYRFFKEKVKSFCFDDIKIRYQCNKSETDLESHIYFKLDKETVSTNSELPISTIEKISEQVFSFLNEENV